MEINLLDRRRLAGAQCGLGEGGIPVATQAGRRGTPRRGPVRASTPSGERTVEPGACVLFPSGPEGARQVTNRTDGPVRILLISSFALPRAAVQVDSDKMMIRWGVEPDDRAWFPVDAAVDYWEGVAE